jgi:hypothetical protein
MARVCTRTRKSSGPFPTVATCRCCSRRGPEQHLDNTPWPRPKGDPPQITALCAVDGLIPGRSGVGAVGHHEPDNVRRMVRPGPLRYPWRRCSAFAPLQTLAILPQQVAQARGERVHFGAWFRFPGWTDTSVRASCLAFAVETRQDGIWGGTTSDERHAMRHEAPWRGMALPAMSIGPGRR